jgi:hypothetical protein
VHGVDSKWAKHLLLLLLGALLEVELFKKCPPLRREAHFQVTKTRDARTTFGSSDVEKVHTIVARSTLPSQNGKGTIIMFEPLLEIRMLKKCTPLWREAHFQVKKHEMLEPLLEVQILKKCIPLWREAHCQVKW